MTIRESLVRQEDVLSILNTIPGSLLILLPDAPTFTFVGATDSYLADTYLRRQQILGKGVFEALTDDPNNIAATGVKNLTASLNYVLAHKKEHRMPDQRYDIFNPYNSNWEYRSWRPLNKPVVDAAGQLQYIIHWVQDVTEQSKLRQRAAYAEERAAESEERFRLMAEISPNLVWMLNPDGSYKFVNETTLNFLGVTQEEIARVGWQAFMHPDDLPRVIEAVRNAVANQRTYSYEHQLRTASGEYRWVFSQAVPHYLADGTMDAYVGASVDIHELKLAREKLEASEAALLWRVAERTRELSLANDSLQQMNKELGRSNDNLEEFAYAASHDLKEPIRKIHFFSQRLKEQLQGQLGDAERRSLTSIERATQRMYTLIDDLLLYSHVSQRPPEKEKVDLNEKVRNVLEDLELDIEEKKATVQVGPLPVVTGYRRQLQQLFQNLISNALKYSKQQFPPVIHITSDTELVDGKCCHVINIEDNGIGFEQQYAGKIFQMFSRLHGKGEYSGNGVGLSIVKKVAENHNGFIRVKSTPGTGTTFSFYLPASLPHGSLVP